MSITNINIAKTHYNDKILAFVSITLNNCITIKDIKIVQGKNRCFVAMPACRDADGIYKDIIHPMNSDIRVKFEEKILDAYRNCRM